MNTKMNSAKLISKRPHLESCGRHGKRGGLFAPLLPTCDTQGCVRWEDAGTGDLMVNEKWSHFGVIRGLLATSGGKFAGNIWRGGKHL